MIDALRGRVDYLPGNAATDPHRLQWRHERVPSPGRRPGARMAAAPPAEPARARLRRRHLDSTPELRRNRPLAAQPRHAAALGGPARAAAARAEPVAGRRRLCAGIPGEGAVRSGADSGAARDRPGAGRARALSGRRGRPPLERRRGQPCAWALDWPGPGAPAGAAGQCTAPRPAPGRAGGAHRELRRAAYAPANAPAPAL